MTFPMEKLIESFGNVAVKFRQMELL
jgi:hypothetical protein